VLKEIHHIHADAMIDGIPDLEPINKLFTNLTSKDKLKIFYYGHYVTDSIYQEKKNKTFF